MLAAERAQARAEASAKQASKLEKQLQLRQGVRIFLLCPSQPVGLFRCGCVGLHWVDPLRL